MVPEDAQNEAPPSYASAQADAVPPYWETTVHAPFSPDSPGDMIIDNLPTGTLFSFLWNMLVTVSFQFVGFLLTYLLHTTHAARFGSRAGLGVILIQYGFALRGRIDGTDGTSGANGDAWAGWSPGSAAEAAEYYNNNINVTSATPTSPNSEDVNAMVADATKQWFSFFLMTIGKCLTSGMPPLLLTATPLRFRLVRPPDVFTAFLARQALGARNLGVSTRECHRCPRLYVRSFPV
jgi:hypothetical protein